MKRIIKMLPGVTEVLPWVRVKICLNSISLRDEGQ